MARVAKAEAMAAEESTALVASRKRCRDASPIRAPPRLVDDDEDDEDQEGISPAAEEAAEESEEEEEESDYSEYSESEYEESEDEGN